MRYLFETKVQIISDCKNGMFVVRPEGRGVTLMDTLGQIYDFDFENITPRDDGTFLCQVDKYKTYSLLDRNLNVLVSDAKEIGEFTNDGVALVTYFDDSNFNGIKQWIKRDGTIFGNGFQPESDFAYGFGAVKAEDSDVLEIVKYSSDSLPLFNIENGKPRVDSLKRTGVYVNGFMPFKNPNYTIIELHNKKYVMDKELNIVTRGFDKGYQVNSYGKALVYEKNRLTNRPEFSIYDAQKQKNIFQPFSYFTNLDKDIYKIPCKDKLYRYVSFKGIPINNEGYADGSEFENDFAIVTGLNTVFRGKSTYLKKDGTRFKNWYDECYPKSEGLFAVNDNGKGMFLNDNEQQVGRTFKRVSPFVNEHSVIDVNGGQTYINRKFMRFIDTFDEARAFSENMGVVKTNDEYDAISAGQNYLSEISKYAKEISKNPIEVFLNLPENVYADSKFENELFELAEFMVNSFSDAMDVSTLISKLTDAHKKYSRYAEGREKEL